MGSGQWAVAMGSGQWAVAMGSGQWAVAMGSGQWAVAMGNGQGSGGFGLVWCNLYGLVHFYFYLFLVFCLRFLFSSLNWFVGLCLKLLCLYS